MEQKEVTLRHLEDLCVRAERTGRRFYSGFLSPAEQENFRRLASSRDYAYCFRGGTEHAERRILCAGETDSSGETDAEEIPISVLKISPVSEKYGEEMSHRDYLGALMNLGIDRSLTGDILVRGKEAWVFCLSSAKEMLAGALNRRGQTEVRVTETDADAPELQPRFVPMEVNAASERLDAVTAAFTGLSREKTSELFSSEKILVNSRVETRRDVRLKEGDILTVRGFGKAVYDGVARESRKGRLFLSLRKYG